VTAHYAKSANIYGKNLRVFFRVIRAILKKKKNDGHKISKMKLVIREKCSGDGATSQLKLIRGSWIPVQNFQTSDFSGIILSKKLIWTKYNYQTVSILYTFYVVKAMFKIHISLLEYSSPRAGLDIKKEITCKD
jgi:hypothetical protein